MPFPATDMSVCLVRALSMAPIPAWTNTTAGGRWAVAIDAAGTPWSSRRISMMVSLVKEAVTRV